MSRRPGDPSRAFPAVSRPSSAVDSRGAIYDNSANRCQRAVRGVVAIGEAAPLVRDALSGVVPVVEAASMREAVARGYEAAAPDGVVLLAPACASFDWFRDYAERGNSFKEEVKHLKQKLRG